MKTKTERKEDALCRAFISYESLRSKFKEIEQYYRVYPHGNFTEEETAKELIEKIIEEADEIIYNLTDTII